MVEGLQAAQDSIGPAWLPRSTGRAPYGRAIGTFAFTNIDDAVVLAVFFGQARGHRGANLRIIGGQYLGFMALLAVSLAGAIVGTALLPTTALPYLGLLPIALGFWAGWTTWRERRRGRDEGVDAVAASAQSMRVWRVAVVTFGNGGDNIGVYVPIFAIATVRTSRCSPRCFLSEWRSGASPLGTSPPIRSSLGPSRAGATSFCR